MFFIALFFFSRLLFYSKRSWWFFSTREFACGWMNPGLTSLQRCSLLCLCVLSVMMSVAVVLITVPNSCGDSILRYNSFASVLTLVVLWGCRLKSCVREVLLCAPAGSIHIYIYIYIYFYEGGRGNSACALNVARSDQRLAHVANSRS